MSKEQTIHDVEHEARCLETDAEQQRSGYLREHGWTYTCSTPGCVWQWLKVWRGVQWNYSTSKDALNAERFILEMGDEAQP